MRCFTSQKMSFAADSITENNGLSLAYSHPETICSILRFCRVPIEDFNSHLLEGLFHQKTLHLICVSNDELAA